MPWAGNKLRVRSGGRTDRELIPGVVVGAVARRLPVRGDPATREWRRHLPPWNEMVMKFFLGIFLGAVGMWAYRTGKLDTLKQRSPDTVKQAFNNPASTIAHPTPAEVAGRPDEPLPGQPAQRA